MSGFYRCVRCKSPEAIWAVQPWGPDERVTVTTLGSHYRGFPVIKLCDECLQTLRSGKKIIVTYKKRQYVIGGETSA